MDKITEAVVTVFTAIIGVAILSVLVSPKSQTSSVIQAVASGFRGLHDVSERAQADAADVQQIRIVIDDEHLRQPHAPLRRPVPRRPVPRLGP